MARLALDTIVPPAGATSVANRGRFPLMDSVRALAAFSIFIFHVFRELEPGGWVHNVTNALSIGVPVFFVISGFLLYRPFAVAHLSGARPPQTIPYAWRRALRIVPAFWVALGVFIAFSGQDTPVREWPFLFGFMQVYDPTHLTDGLDAAWSLNNEVVYYAMLPVIAFAVRSAAGPSRPSRLRWEIAGLVGLLLVSIGYKAAFFSFGDLASPRDSSFLFHPAWNLDIFVIGMALALWSAHREVTGDEDAWRAPTVARAGRWWLAALALFVGTTFLADVYTQVVGNSLTHALRASAALLFVIPAVAVTADRTVPRRALSARWLMGFGTISYAFFLWHAMFLNAVMSLRTGREQHALTDTGLVVIAFAGAIVASIVSWVVIERPALSLKRLVPERRELDTTGGLESGRVAAAGSASE
jgi:peptidoglycan/LPS O-acetylase OafA/YrhL